MNISKEYRILLVAFAFGMFAILFIWLSNAEYAYEITREDKEVELLTALIYFIALVICFVAYLGNKRILLPLVWTFLLILFLGEETSWFQRVFDYSVPSVENVNAQGEFNLHNLDVFNGDSLDNLDAIWATLLNTQHLFRVGFFGYFLVLPFLMYNSKINRMMKKLGYVKPSKIFVFIILFVFIFSFYLATVTEYEVKMAIAETREMLYAFFIMIYVVLYIWMKKNNFKRSEL